MTSREKAIISNVITHCVNRVREEDDHAQAVDDVLAKLAFLADWLTTVKVEPTMEAGQPQVAGD